MYALTKYVKKDSMKEENMENIYHGIIVILLLLNNGFLIIQV